MGLATSAISRVVILASSSLFQVGSNSERERGPPAMTSVRVHDLHYTFGMRLRAQGVGLENRQDLLGHYAERMTTHNSRADIQRLVECVEFFCRTNEKPELTLVKCA